MTLAGLASVFLRIGCLSFGGPAAQIALMHRMLVAEKGWLDEAQFLRALSFCMLLPGPEAMQLATYAGWRLRGVAGGLVAGGLFVAPGALVVGALALLYARFGALDPAQTLFLGLKAAVVAIVAQAIWRLSRRALRSAGDVLLAGLAFAALFLFALPFPLVIGLAALWGAARAGGATGPAPSALPPLGAPLRLLAIGAALWALPILALHLAGAAFLTDIALFFSRLALVSFGGAYAGLAYMAQEAVATQGWLTAEQMIDALGLAETTPGPLILVTQFVAQVAGDGRGGPALALAAGAVTLWVTFLPCFLWIFAGAPLIDWLEHRRRLSAALSAVTAAVVGVVANLSLWFALHVLFGALRTVDAGPLHLARPVPDSFDPIAALLVLLSLALVFAARWPVPAVLAAGVGAAAIAGAAGLG